MKIIIPIALLVIIQCILPSCKDRGAGQEVQIPLISVNVAPVVKGRIEDYINLNGKVIYLKKNKIVAPVSAYITQVNVEYGEVVGQGDILFVLQTKESKALNTGTNDIKVPALSGGTISELFVNQAGTYKVEGDLLCTIVENSDLVIQVNVPYEYNHLLKKGASCDILLSDHTSFRASIFNILPSINEPDQTQTAFLKPLTSINLPENLNLTARFVLNMHSQSFIVPREAVMTNEKQTSYWVMKLVHDSLSVQVPVQKGLENDSVVEILSPLLNTDDLIITAGAYGLPDSSVVMIRR